MAKLTVAFTVLLSLIAFSQASIPSEQQPGNENRAHESLTTIPVSDSETIPTIDSLPIDSPASDVITLPLVPLWEIPETKTITVKEIDTDNTPNLVRLTFRPVNRRFPDRQFPSFRNRRPCRHHLHHHQQFKPSGGQVNGLDQISYGDDMILTDERGDVPFQPTLRTGDHRIYWTRFNRVGITIPHHHHHHHHHHEEEVEKGKKYHGMGFMKSFRKFLKHHF